MFSLPAGLTIDTSKLAQDTVGARAVLGEGQTTLRSGGIWKWWNTLVAVESNKLQMIVDEDVVSGTRMVSAAYPAAPDAGVTDQEWNLNAVVPIVEWAGSTIATTNTQVEYAYNSGTWNADDLTSFAYGPQGADIPGDLTSKRIKRVRFSSAIQPTDVVKLQLSNDDGLTWIDVPGFSKGEVATRPIQYTPGTSLSPVQSFGVGIQQVNSTEVEVVFGRYYSSDTGGSNQGWSFLPNGRWRVVKSSNPLAVGNLAQPRILAQYRVSGSGIITFSANATSDVVWDEILFETQNIINTSTGEVTIPRNGYYKITAAGMPNTRNDWGATLENWRIYHQIDRGSGYTLEGSFVSKVNDGLDHPDSIFSSRLYKLNAGDKVKIQVANLSATSSGIILGATYGFFQVEEVSDRIFPASF